VFSANSLESRYFLRHSRVWFATLAVALPACTTWGAEPLPATPATTVPANAATAAADTATAAAAVSPNYRIGPGDTLKVSVFQNDELTATIPVRPDGKISTPLVEDMVAVGKTPTELARDIEKSLAMYIKSPKVSVVVTNALSIFSQVKVIGQVLHPQSLPYREGMTVLDAVLEVGGLGQFAAGNRAHIVRKENGKESDIKIKLESLINNGDMTQDLVLKPGDVVVVPETRF
jgi:polysaccharide biosynthesis/export protein